ncbi:MAG: 5'/3'-nucleotidase SurE [Spirochaetes bacterium]|nr:5'/3'-nucleotidase SurE [Spirochaetota bacterium]
MSNILLSNDDGIESRGLWALKSCFESDDTVRSVFIVAPDRERSATGHAISLHEPIRTKEIQKGRVFSVDGTPVDAVHMAILGLIPQKIDLVVTGINNGLNLGTDVFYSGTVSAAMHAVSHGVPAIAVSIDNHGDIVYFETAAFFARKVADIIRDKGTFERAILNINVPNLPLGDVAGVEITRLGKRRYNDSIVEKKDDRNNRYYLIQGVLSHDIGEDETDVRAIAEHRVSITPLGWDITAHHAVAELRNRGFHKLK